MTQVVEPRRGAARADRPDKVAARRAELAAAVLQTLGELGYARTSLREIAQNSEFSHGVLHYYFADKIDLITYAVRSYKEECVRRYDEIVAAATTPAELRAGFALAMAGTLRDEAPLHRLWYDLRNQSMFDESFRADVTVMDAALEAMIWRVVARHAELADTPAAVPSPVAYAMFDGLFHQHLVRFSAGDATAVEDLESRCADMLAAVAPANPA